MDGRKDRLIVTLMTSACSLATQLHLRHLHPGRLLLVWVAVLASGWAPLALARPEAPAGPYFDPIAFFTGDTEGNGRLKVRFSRSKPMRVLGHGALQDDGMLVLDQTVMAADDPPKARQWRIRQTAPGHYAGSLTDASGPVTLEVAGNRMRIRYRARGGLGFSQVLTLEPGGQVARNVMHVRKMGMVVATIREMIRRR